MQSRLDHLADHSCTLCELNETTESVCVMGRGRPKSRVIIIGEAPGAAEEETGEPFRGAAGKVLDQALRESGLAELDPYITNAVKCRPPDNRTPDRDEWESCSDFLRAEIAAVRPDGVLLLGNVALRAVYGVSGITSKRGVPLPLTNKQQSAGITNEMHVMATVHPAYVLRNPGQLSTFSEDIKRFYRLLDGSLAVVEVKTRAVTTESALRAVCAYLAKQPVLSYDVENRDVPWTEHTYGSESGLKGGWGILCLGISADGETCFVIPLLHPDSDFRKGWKRLLRTYVKPILERPGVKLVAQNGKHDNVQLAGAGVFVEHTFDIMLAAHLLDENRPKNLGFLSQTLLGADVYKGGLDLKPEVIMRADLRNMMRYNGTDTGYTWQLREKLIPELQKQPRVKRLFQHLMMPASNMIQQVEYAGWYVNKERAYDRIDELQGMIDKQLKVLGKGKNGFTGNPNSTQQLGRWLFSSKKRGGLGLSPMEMTATGNPSTKEAVLLHYHEVPQIQALMRYRTLQLKWMNTCLIPWVGRLDARSRIHTTYKLYNTVTGRLSGDLQQVPRDPFIRTIFGAPPGRKLISADYSQVELRIAAHCAQERRMMRAFQLGEDLHMVTAMALTGKAAEDVGREERKKAKPVNFGFLYGMYPKKFQAYAFENYGVSFTMAEAELAREQYFSMFPDLQRWYDRQERLVRSRGWVQSPLGRVRHLPDIHSPDSGVQREAIRQAINSPVQGTASDLMLFGMVQLQKVLDPNECFMVGTLHDGIFFECAEDKTDKWSPVIKHTLENLPLKETFLTELSVPIVCDIEVSQHWSEGFEY